ncbi:MAG: hypothetical protein RIQ79_712 [Verrucomicrobiota bacterium]|jgi:hypothetical protein
MSDKFTPGSAADHALIREIEAVLHSDLHDLVGQPVNSELSRRALESVRSLLPPESELRGGWFSLRAPPEKSAHGD